MNTKLQIALFAFIGVVILIDAFWIISTEKRLKRFFLGKKAKDLEDTIVILETEIVKLNKAKEEIENFNRNYMVNPSNIIAQANLTIAQKQNMVGLISSINGKNAIYLSNTSVGNSITSGLRKLESQSREYLISTSLNPIKLNDILLLAGAKIVHEKPENEEEYIDFSPEALDKLSILELFQ